ncbi:MAG: hypothetical protein MST00_05910 [Tenericutes bacterium]|nr:hypothetical protein [Mycoplasmatota bacterium]
MKKILLLFLMVVCVSGCTNTKEEENHALIETVKNEQGTAQEFNKYTTISEDSTVYLEKTLTEVYFNKDSKKQTTIKEFLKTGSIDEITSVLDTDVSYDDGGSQLYTSEEYDFSVLVCRKFYTKNNDIYIGNFDMYFADPMCED